MKTEGGWRDRPVAGWLVAALLLSLPTAASLLNPEGMKAFASIIGAAAWPAAFLIALWWFRPEVSRVVDRLTEFNAFGVNAKLKTLENALSQSEWEAQGIKGLTKSPTEEQVGRATEIKDVLGENLDLVRSRIEALSDEYQSIRASMPASPERTRKMEVVVAKMRTIGLAAYPLRYDLACSPSPGTRLQAVTCLQIKTDFDMLDWLAERVGIEKPFIGFHSLVALNVAASAPTAKSHKNTLEAALKIAETYENRFGTDTDRRMMLEEFRRRVREL